MPRFVAELNSGNIHAHILTVGNTAVWYRRQNHTQPRRPLLANLTVTPHAAIPEQISGCVSAASVDWMAHSPTLLLFSLTHQNTAPQQLKNNNIGQLTKRIISISNNLKRMSDKRSFGGVGTDGWILGHENINNPWWETQIVGLDLFQQDARGVGSGDDPSGKRLFVCFVLFLNNCYSLLRFESKIIWPKSAKSGDDLL